MNPEWVTVARTLRGPDAHLLRSVLEAAGVESVVVDENLIQNNWLFAVACGGVKVQVRPDDRIHALVVLRHPGSFLAVAEAIPAPHCPSCHGARVRRVRSGPALLLAPMVLMTRGAPEPLVWDYRCGDCGARWVSRFEGEDEPGRPEAPAELLAAAVSLPRRRLPALELGLLVVVLLVMLTGIFTGHARVLLALSSGALVYGLLAFLTPPATRAVLTSARLTLDDAEASRDYPVGRLHAVRTGEGALVVEADGHALLASDAVASGAEDAVLLRESDMRRLWTEVRRLHGEDTLPPENVA